jgi:putative membrane protein
MRESIPGDEVYFFKSAFIMRQVAWCHSLSHGLRGQNELDVIEKYLTRSDIHQLKNYNNVPMALLIIHGQALAEAYQKGWINSYQQVELDQTLTRFSNSMGGCERIKKTVFPVTYSMYIHLSLLFIILLLPFSLLGIFGVLSIPMVVAISAVFFLIEKMAVHLQDPFENKPTDTPMTAICFTIERDLRQIINDPHQAPETAHENAYYVL